MNLVKDRLFPHGTYFTIPILDEVSFRIVIFEEMVSKDTWAYSAMMMRHSNMGSSLKPLNSV